MPRWAAHRTRRFAAHMAFLVSLAFTTGQASAGSTCAAGCAIAQHEAEELSIDVLETWLSAYAEAPKDAPELPLETLLFHAEQTRWYLETHGSNLLPPEHADFLARELDRTHALVELRLVDLAGEPTMQAVQAQLPPQLVRLGEKEHHQVPSQGQLQAFDYSGTVKRVGLKHLWGRL